jgi:hypothetical protein
MFQNAKGLRESLPVHASEDFSTLRIGQSVELQSLNVERTAAGLFPLAENDGFLATHSCRE